MNYTACLPGSHIANPAARQFISRHFMDWLASFVWMREMAHWADSEITGSGDAASLFNTVDILWKTAKSDGNFEFPSATHTFRRRPCHFVLLIGLPRNFSLKCFCPGKKSHSRRGMNSVSGEAPFFS